MLQHRFYRRQPDLNVTNLAVRNEIAKIIGFWMELGLSGFRVDAVPFLLETTGITGGAAALPQPHDFLRDLRAFLSRRNGDAILLGARATCRTTRPARSSGTATATN